MSVHFVFYFIKLLWLILLPATISQTTGGSGCNETCGNVAIPSPFGIKEGCYPNPWFKVTCNETNDGKKPFISGINLELIQAVIQVPIPSQIQLYLTSFVTVKSPVTHVNCGEEEEGHNGTIAVASDYLIGSPFLLSERANMIGVIGCGNLVTIVNNKGIVVGGCLQPRCGDLTSNGCYAQILELENLKSLSAIITKFYTGESKRCCSIFMVGFDYLNLETAFLPEIDNHSTQVPVVLDWPTVHKCNLEAAQCQQLGVAPKEPNCTEKCGNVDIPYPFGIEDECYKDEWFQVICEETPNGLTPFLLKTGLQIIAVAFPVGIVRVNHSVTHYNCPYKNRNAVSVNLKGSPFYFSNLYNSFGSVGCGNLVRIFNNQTDLITSCVQPSCRNVVASRGVTCAMPVPPGISSFVVNMTWDYPGNDGIGRKNSSCSSTFVASKVDNSLDLLTITTSAYLPAELEWAKPKSGQCEFKEDSKISCTPDGKYCWTNLSPTFLCVCSNLQNSVVYSSNICVDLRNCKYPKFNYCHMLCLNEPNKNCSTQCPEGYKYITSERTCKLEQRNPTSSNEKTRDWGIIIGCSTCTGTILVLVLGWHMYKALKRRKNNKLRQKYFKRNGGLLLQQQWSAKEGNVDRIKLFTSKELEKATDYYNENRILGQGGQGTVYKGMLVDGSIVAIKKSKLVVEKLLDDKKLEQFINEVIILSQINHRNVVKLLGCCLETEVPLLVYEFIPNGTLSKLIEDQNDEFPLTWEMRLRIATEIGNALSYLHSAASVRIYHRDIKSSNILLDDKYRAKVSDFGTSRSIALEQTHLTTGVQGTFGYMDPEYFRSNQFTEKSDVYSFGVVLVELLTGQKPISSKQSEEVRSLVYFFLLNMKQNTLFEILDPSMVNNGQQEEIVAVAKLAKRCLNLNGNKRPTMKQVAMELELIRKSEEANGIQQNDDEGFDSDDTMEAWTMDSCSTRSIINKSVTLS